MKVAGGQCEGRYIVNDDLKLAHVVLPCNALLPDNDDPFLVSRCPNREYLEFHETQYGSTMGLQRSIQGFMLCKGCHQYIEMTRHPTRPPRQ